MIGRARTGMAVVFLSLAVYLRTLAPGLTWAHQGADGGDLAAAVASGGIPHPSGYPTYMLVARLFAALPLRDVAFRLNLMSAVCAAATVGLLYLLILALTGRQMDGKPSRPGAGSGAWTANSPPAVAVAAGAALLFAFSPVFWSQALITEVYTLNALFVALLALLAVQQTKRWGVIGLTVGVGLGNHLSLALVIPGLLALAAGDGRSGRGRSAAGRAGAGLALGLAVYLYLPLRAMCDPFVNWANPQTLDGFLWLVTGAPYRAYVLSLPLADLPARLSAWAALLMQQFGLPGLALLLLGAWDMLTDSDLRPGGAILFTFLIYGAYALSYRTADSYVYLIPAYLVATVWLARGLQVVAQAARSWVESHSQPSQLSPRALPLMITILLFLLPLRQAQANWSALDLSSDNTAQVYLESAARRTPPHALIITASDEHTFALWYQQAIEGTDSRLVIDRDLTQFAWQRQQIRQRAPDLAATPDSAEPSEYVAALVAEAQRKREVFLADDDADLLQRFVWQKQGDWWQLQTEGK